LSISNRQILKLDIDSKEIDIIRFYIISRLLRMNIYSIIKKKTKHGYHLTLEISSPYINDDRDIVLVQCLLGSDYKRELFNFLRVKHKCRRWNVLFTKKYRMKNGRLVLVSKEVSSEGRFYKKPS
jgi:hypothetical protein